MLYARVGNLWPASRIRLAKENHPVRGLVANFENFIAKKVSSVAMQAQLVHKLKAKYYFWIFLKKCFQ